MSIYKKLNDARLAFHSLELKKSGHNKFAGYNYFELGDFLIPALRVFAAHSLCARISFTAELATMTIVDVEMPGLTIVITSPMGSAALKGCHEVQNIGAVETYQRRYLWVAALEIVEHDALDSGDPKDVKPQKVKDTAPISATREAWEALDEDTQRSLRVLAQEVTAAMPDAQRALDVLAFSQLDNDRKAGLWHLLDSATRSGLKKAQAAL